MAGKKWFSGRPLWTALSCVLLLSCGSDANKGVHGDPSKTGDAGLHDGPGGEPRDASGGAGAPDTGRPPVSGNDARVSPPPSDAGVDNPGDPRDARAGGGTDTSVPDARVVDTGTPPVSGGKSVFVAVGYSGVRFLSSDGGKTWGNKVVSGGSGDDTNLLRTVTYAKGLFVAAGWKIWTSPDGVTWLERTNPAKQWFGGLEYGNNLFVAAGGTGQTVYSTDGMSWTSGKGTGGEAARSVAFGNGMFAAATDPGNWWSTANGIDWTKLSGGHGSAAVMWCKDKFSKPGDCSDPMARNGGHTAFGNGVYVSAAGNKIERSEDNGKSWSSVSVDTAVEDVAFGLLP